MWSRVQAGLRCSSQANANTVLNSITGLITKTQQPSTFELRNPYIRTETPDFWVHFDVSYSNPIAATTLRDDIVSGWTQGAQANRILTGSWCRIHDCRHDEGVGACVATEAVK